MLRIDIHFCWEHSFDQVVVQQKARRFFCLNELRNGISTVSNSGEIRANHRKIHSNMKWEIVSPNFLLFARPFLLLLWLLRTVVRFRQSSNNMIPSMIESMHDYTVVAMHTIGKSPTDHVNVNLWHRPKTTVPYELLGSQTILIHSRIC